MQEWAEEDRNWSKAGRYLAFVLTRDNQLTLVDLGDAVDIDARIAETRSVIEDSDLLVEDLETYTADTDAALLDLYQRLILPLSQHLGSIDRIILAPDGELNKVPFAALRTPDGHYLVETHTISYVTSGRDLLPRERGEDPESICCWRLPWTMVQLHREAIPGVPPATAVWGRPGPTGTFGSYPESPMHQS